jgi:hypothetical protein
LAKILPSTTVAALRPRAAEAGVCVCLKTATRALLIMATTVLSLLLSRRGQLEARRKERQHS